MVIGVVRPSDSSGAEIDSRKFSGEQRRGAGRQAAGGAGAPLNSALRRGKPVTAKE